MNDEFLDAVVDGDLLTVTQMLGSGLMNQETINQGLRKAIDATDIHHADLGAIIKLLADFADMDGRERGMRLLQMNERLEHIRFGLMEYILDLGIGDGVKISFLFRAVTDNKPQEVEFIVPFLSDELVDETTQRINIALMRASDVLYEGTDAFNVLKQWTDTRDTKHALTTAMPLGMGSVGRKM